uniref:hypothetical protein n=1 Tax=Escherichia coli TaxID=562 RepID=UPI003392555E
MVPSSAMAMLQLDVRVLVVSASSDAAMLQRGEKIRLGFFLNFNVCMRFSGRNRAGDQEKPRGLMCSSSTLAGFFDLSDASVAVGAARSAVAFSRRASAPGKQLQIVARHCCKVSDEAAFCLIQRPYISKTLLTRRISPRGSP